ncbi:SLOG family protein [Desulforamulus aquiferis]|uniref:SLOG family protein n=1 Tax=Desulforamulus aquiferis TaxID=1397668 RepID=A0AAW7ZG53_9FIRM|nr:SLOG family protein [Desulforamulus aquiferis]MDO7788401.1 SLOG family protein [Desulforamulus aquiferis]
MNKLNTCCFTGHRKLPKEKIEHIIKRLNHEIDNLISKGVTNFISGGSFGFEQVAASLIIAKKEMGRGVRLIFAKQDKLWSAEQRELYNNLLAEADEIIYVLEEYHNGCMKKRNRYIVDCSAYCICALLHTLSGTDRTVRYARRKGLHVINVAD